MAGSCLSQVVQKLKKASISEGKEAAGGGEALELGEAVLVPVVRRLGRMGRLGLCPGDFVVCGWADLRRVWCFGDGGGERVVGGARWGGIVCVWCW